MTIIIINKWFKLVVVIIIGKKKFQHISIKIPFSCLYASGIQIKI